MEQKRAIKSRKISLSVLLGWREDKCRIQIKETAWKT
jgi:hypothetical protein